jgi:dienelactone hydrolase
LTVSVRPRVSPRRRARSRAPLVASVIASVIASVFALVVACDAASRATIGAARPASGDERVILTNEGWRLVGDLTLPHTVPATGAPAVLLLNGAGRDRAAYAGLARRLATLGIASLRLDLRGTGESVNLGRFVPFDSSGHNEAIQFHRSWSDVAAALQWLSARSDVDGAHLGAVGASYSGEVLAHAMRVRPNGAPPRAVVALSPGSFSDSSLARVDGDARDLGTRAADGATLDSLVTALDSAVQVGPQRAASGDGAWEVDYRFGLAGIADLYADLYDATSERRYLERALSRGSYQQLKLSATSGFNGASLT